MQKVAVTTTTVGGFTAETEYCTMYRKAVEGKNLTISSQFIPDTVHAVLTVALYSGDSCDVESATKAGEITIDIPRLQLSGAMDLSMTATGSCQTPLEGNALASGCAGCDGKAVYATITQYLTGKKWYDNFQRITWEWPTITIGQALQSVQLVAYAVGGSMTPKKITQDANLVWVGTPGTTQLVLSSQGALSSTQAVAAGTFKGTVTFSDNGVAKLRGERSLILS